MPNPNSNSTWGSFTPVMPSFLRLMASVVVLVIVEAVILGFPGITQNISGTNFTIANVSSLLVGLVVAFLVLKYGTQIADSISEHYQSYKTWTPLLAYFFQITAIIILYFVTGGIATSYFTATPWVFPLVFLLMALIPTLKVVVNLVHDLENPSTAAAKHTN
jgi:hypothetical protein